MYLCAEAGYGSAVWKAHSTRKSYLDGNVDLFPHTLRTVAIAALMNEVAMP